VSLLALETATSTCGVAVLQGDAVLAEMHLHRPRVHAERLTPLVEALLAQAEVELEALDAVAVSRGPGSYTGLRIGASTAKGWALAAKVPLVGVSTLAAYAASVRPIATPGDVVCALLDARRDEVYAGAYRRTSTGMHPHAPVQALPVTALPEWLGAVDGRLWGVGDGGEKARDVLAAAHDALSLVPADTHPPSAAWVARCAQQRLATDTADTDTADTDTADTDTADDVATFEPLYVKDVHATPAPSPFA
jgi:tRNA threonylcarbamoyladenosine biosynthesis protein TsaB